MTTFDQIPHCGYFFFQHSVVPHMKVGETHAVQVGTHAKRVVKPDEEVHSLVIFPSGGVVVGGTIVPIYPSWDSKDEETAKRHDEYVAKRLAIEADNK